jgi:aminoglycoside phosphotransferase
MSAVDRDDILAAVALSSGAELLSSRRISAEANSDGFITGHDVEFRTSEGVQRHTVYIESTPPATSSDGPAGTGTTSDQNDSKRVALAESSSIVMVRDNTGEQVAVWLYPRDPRLPALPAAVFPDAAAVLVERLGLTATNVSVSLLSYRPGKRAVVRLDSFTAGSVTRIFVKVVRPETAETLHGLHVAWLAHGVQVPRALAWSSEGLVALESLSGAEAMKCLGSLTSPERLVEAVDELCSRIATVKSVRVARASLITRLRWYERRVGEMPGANARAIRHARREIATRYNEAPPPTRLVTIHGDLHLSQLFVDPDSPSTITGVLDIDTAGWGDPADDAAALWAHLTVTAEFADKRGDHAGAQRMRGLAHAFKSHWRNNSDEGFVDRTAAIAATHLLGHVLSGSIEAANVGDLISRALSDESVLTSSFPASHLAAK